MTCLFEIPMLADHHNHPLFYAAFMHGVDLRDVESEEAASAVIRDHADREAGPITIAHGWNDSRYTFSEAGLDALPPAVVFNVSLHGLRLNAAGAEVLAREHPDAVDRLDDQLWFDRNLQVVLNLFTSLNASVERLTSFFAWLHTQGVRHAEEMLLVGGDEIRLFREAGLTERTRFWAAPDTFRSLPSALQADVYGLKYFTDGAIGTRSAALTESYRDADPGRLLYDDTSLARALADGAETGKGLAIHAIGDRAVDQVVATLATSPSRAAAREIRIEHAQFISEETARTAKRLGLTLSMQPNFSDDTTNYRDRLPASCLGRNNPFRMLIDEVGFVPGEDLVFGSDGMPHGATEALRQSLFPPLAGQRLTVDEFVAGYCVEAGDGPTIAVEVGADDVITAVVNDD